MNINSGLTKLEERIKINLGIELQTIIKVFRENKNTLNSLISASPTAYQAFAEITREFPTPNKQHSPWGFFMGFEKMPNIEKESEFLYFPIIHPFQGVFATAFEESNELADFMLNFALRSIVSYPLGRSIVYMMDSNISGDFNQLSFISTSPEDLDEEKNQFHYATLSTDKEYVLTEIAEIINTNIRNYVSKYNDLTEYNKYNASMPVPYRFLFIRDIGGVFSDNQINTLANLINSGNATKAGVYVFFSYKNSDITTSGFGSSASAIKRLVNLSYLITVPKKKISESIIQLEKKVTAVDVKKTITFVESEKPPITIMSFKDDINRQFSSGVLWESNYSINKPNHLFLPVGFENAKDVKEIDLDFDYSPHIYVGGKTGSGKTILLHNLILNGALKYSPEELRYYLVDLKRGVSFIFYKNLPHLAALSASENPFYALSVLETFALEIKTRGTLFKQNGVQKIGDYNILAKNKGHNTLPCLIAIIDEFQELFSKNDSIANKAERLISIIHTQGRSFGIILALSTQSVGNVNTNISQVGIKFSLISNPKDSVKLIGNEAAASLRGKGRAILNKSETGEKKYNQEFQVAFIDESKELQNYIAKIQDIFLKQNNGQDKLDHLVFSDSDVSARISDNQILFENLQNNQQFLTNKNNDIFIGMPAFCRKEHVKFHFHRNSQSNMVVVGNDRPSALRLIGVIAIQFLIIYKNSEVYISDLQKQGDVTYNKLSFLSNKKNTVKHTGEDELQATLNRLHQILVERESNLSLVHMQPEILYALIDIKMNSIFRIKKDPFAINQDITPIEMLQNLIDRGPNVGIHVLLYGFNDRNIDDVIPGISKEMEIKVALRGGNPTKILRGYGSGELVDSNGMGLILMPEEMGLTYTDGETPGDPFVVYDATGNPKLEQTFFGHLFSVLPNKK